MTVLGLSSRLAIRPSFTQLSQGVFTGAAISPFPPPTGYQWAIVFENGSKVFENEQQAVMLEKVNS